MFDFLRRFLFATRYEEAALLAQYVRMQYGPFVEPAYAKSEPFYQELITRAAPHIREGARALDVGCALGRLVFEWEKLGATAVGIDPSRRFIQYCRLMQAKKAEGSFALKDHSEARLICGKFEEEAASLGQFDFVSCVNVIDRVDDPAAFLKTLSGSVRSGGALLITDPYDWELSPAPRRAWIEDFVKTFPANEWEIIWQEPQVPFTVPSSPERTYACHAALLQKLF